MLKNIYLVLSFLIKFDIFKSLSNFSLYLFSKNLLNYKIVNDNLTYYRQTEDNVSSKFKKYSKNWWKRRNEAHDYYFYFMKKNNLKTKKNLDFYFTKILNKFI